MNSASDRSHLKPLPLRPDTEAPEPQPTGRPGRAAAILIRAALRAGVSSARAAATAARALVHWAKLTGQDPGKAARGAVRGAASVEDELEISETQAASAAALGAMQAARSVVPGRAQRVQRAVMKEYAATCEESGRFAPPPIVTPAAGDAPPADVASSEETRPRRSMRKLALALLRGARGAGFGGRRAIRATSRAMIKQAAHEGRDVARATHAVLDAASDFADEAGMDPDEAVGTAARCARNSAADLGQHAANGVRAATREYRDR